jgi:predicted permease
MPDWKPHVRPRLSALRLSPAREAEIVEELSQHLEDRWRELTAGGAAPEEATRLALADFREGDLLARHMAPLRQASAPPPLTPGAPMASRLPGLHQLVYVFRRLRRSPAFTLAAVLTIAIGLGANSAIFSVVNGILLKPLPYPEPEALVAVWQTAPGFKAGKLHLSPADYFTFREHNRSFDSIGIWNSATVTVTGKGAPEQVRSTYVTEGTLAALRAVPQLGRAFTAKDMEPDGPETVILAHAYWRRKFGGGSSGVGQPLLIDGRPREIIGVLPPGFRGLNGATDVFLPQRFNRAKTHLAIYSFFGIARLKPGVTLAQANADIARMNPITLRSFPPPPGFSVKMFEQGRIQPALLPLHEEVAGDTGKVLWVLMGSLAVVLLIACANVANLLLVRAEGRQQELAVRQALGASRGRIGAELLFESLVLGLLGGAAGLGLAWAALRLLAANAPAFLPRLDSIVIDGPVILFTLLLSLAASLASGLAPAVKLAALNVAGAPGGGTRTLSQTRERRRARNLLVIVQTALAVVLLIASGLMIRTFHSLHRVDPGFRPADLQTFRIFIPETAVKEPDRVVRNFEEIRRKLAEIPGVTMVSFANSIPADGNQWTDTVYAEHRAHREGDLPPLRRFQFVAPGFFQTMGMRLIAGRDFTWTDLYDRRRVAIVSGNTAREIWRDPHLALGQRIRRDMKDGWREIVGVIAGVRHDGASQEAPAMVYWPLLTPDFGGNGMFVQRRVVFALRADRAGSESLMNQVREAVWSVNRDLPLAGVQTMEEVYRASMAQRAFALVMLAIAGGMALLLALVGLYGVISYSVSQRTRELGIRMALGASHRALKSTVVRQGAVLALTGMAFGLAAAAALTRLMSGLLFNTSPLDPATYAAVPAGLLAAAAAASYLPARRVSALDPAEALRVE